MWPLPPNNKQNETFSPWFPDQVIPTVFLFHYKCKYGKCCVSFEYMSLSELNLCFLIYKATELHLGRALPGSLLRTSWRPCFPPASFLVFSHCNAVEHVSVRTVLAVFLLRLLCLYSLHLYQLTIFTVFLCPLPFSSTCISDTFFCSICSTLVTHLLQFSFHENHKRDHGDSPPPVKVWCLACCRGRSTVEFWHHVWSPEHCQAWFLSTTGCGLSKTKTP